MECRNGTRTRVKRTQGFEKKRSEEREGWSRASAASFLFQSEALSDVFCLPDQLHVNLSSALTIRCCRLHDAALGRSAADCGRVGNDDGQLAHALNMHSRICTPYWPPLQVAHVCAGATPRPGTAATVQLCSHCSSTHAVMSSRGPLANGGQCFQSFPACFAAWHPGSTTTMH